MIDGGRGKANFLHVDNLVDAILASLSPGAGDGQAFVLVDEEPSTWREVFEGYHGVLRSAPPLRDLSVAEIRRLRKEQQPGLLKGSFVLPLQLLPDLGREAVASPAMRERLKQVHWVRGLAVATRPLRAVSANQKGTAAGRPVRADEPAYTLPDEATIEFRTLEGRYSAVRARDMLGFASTTTWTEALRRLEKWVEYQHIQP